jgi:hypothetical protein
MTVSHGGGTTARQSPLPPINNQMRGAANPVLLPAWSTPAARTRTGFGVGVGGDRLRDVGVQPGVTVVSSAGDFWSERGSRPLVNNGDRSNRRYLTGAVMAVRPVARGSGTIWLHLIPNELPVINGKQPDQPPPDVRVYVSDATRFQVDGRKGGTSIVDLHLGQMVRVGVEGQITREVEVLAMSGR